MMETTHKSVLNEIEQSRVISLCLQDADSDDFSSSAKQSDKTTRTRRAKTEVKDRRGARKLSQQHAKSFNMGSGVYDSRQKYGLDLDFDTKPSNTTFSAIKSRDVMPSSILNYGMLYKTSRGRITSEVTRGQHEHRQHRRFQLTEQFLEYSQLLQRVSNSIDCYCYCKGKTASVSNNCFSAVP